MTAWNETIIPWSYTLQPIRYDESPIISHVIGTFAKRTGNLSSVV